MKTSVLVFMPLFFAMACKMQESSSPILNTGIYRGVIYQQEQQLPFNFEFVFENEKPLMVIHNDTERIKVDEVVLTEDSVQITMNLFDTEIRARIVENGLEGVYEKNYSEDHILPFKASHGVNSRFDVRSEDPVIDISGSYQVLFTEDDGTTYPAIAKLNQDGPNLYGTFLTETGDYRYLQGIVDGDSLKLSAFDGTHLFLFTAKIKEDSLLGGEFWHGKYTYETWEGIKNMDAVIGDAFELTYLKPGYDKIEFSFPGLNGEPITLQDEKYQDKAMILQIFGTWCPNCMDETIFLTEWYKNKPADIEVLALAYEQKPEFDYASKRVKKMIKKLGVPYEFVIAGTSDKKEASKTLPMLNHIMSFPTTIFISKEGEIISIHTGFSGPGTGSAYDEWKKEFKSITEQLAAN